MGSSSDAYEESLTTRWGCSGNHLFLQGPPKPLQRSNKGISHHKAGRSPAGYILVYADSEPQQHTAPGLGTPRRTITIDLPPTRAFKALLASENFFKTPFLRMSLKAEVVLCGKL